MEPLRKMLWPLIGFQVIDDSNPPDSDEKTSLVYEKSPIISESSLPPLELTDVIGKSGCWQIKILLLTVIVHIPTAWNHLGMSFLAYPVDHWCARPTSANISLETWWTQFLPNTTVKGQEHHSMCNMYLYNRTTETAMKSKTVSCNAYEYDSEFNSIVNEWDLVCKKEWMLSTSQTVYMIGFLLAVMFSGQFADVYGRHPAVMVNSVILIVAGFAALFTNSFFMFSVCRFFVAFGYGGLTLVTFILLIETIGCEYRVRYSYLQSSGWHFGYMILPLIAWMKPDWFTLQIIISAPSVIYICYYWLLPESPRWLLANGHIEKALPILEKAAKTNGKDTRNLRKKAEILANINSQGKENSVTTVLDLLRTPNLRMKTLCLYFLWAATAFVYYGLSLNTNDLEGNHYVNFFLSGFVEIPAAVLCFATLDRFGRKKPLFITFLFGGLACFGVMFVPDRLSKLRTGLGMIGKMFISGSFSILYIFSAETFPTVARNVGVGSSSTVARIGSAIAPFMKDLGSVTDASVPLTLFGILSLISALIVLKMPETNNQPIPESIDQAEKFGKS